MKKFQLSNGENIPALGLGTYLTESNHINEALSAAISAGYKHIDCAAIYGNQRAIGKVFNEVFSSGHSRDDVWITSKLWCDAHKPEDVLPALKKTLADLKLDYLDLYLIHWPVALKAGTALPTKHDDYYSLKKVPLSDTWSAMEECAKEGLVRTIGVSNYSTKKLTELLATATIPPAVNQIEIHPYQQQRKQVEFCKKHNITLTAYCPLGSIGSSITTPDGSTPPPLLKHPVITAIADRHNGTPAQVLLAWLLAQNIVAIPKSITPSRIEENFKSLELTLTTEDMKEIATLDKKARIIDGTPFTLYDSPYTIDNLWDGE